MAVGPAERKDTTQTAAVQKEENDKAIAAMEFSNQEGERLGYYKAKNASINARTQAQVKSVSDALQSLKA